MSENRSDDPASETSDSENYNDEQEWVFYRLRPDWQDVQPIDLDEGNYPVVAIAYSDRCKSFSHAIYQL